jgi:SAM-dependent methyltransferase
VQARRFELGFFQQFCHCFCRCFVSITPSVTYTSSVQQKEQPMVTTTDANRERDRLIERLMRATGGMFEIFTTYLGDRLGLYRALAEGGPGTPAELAGRTGTNERYVREWLEQQTVIGTLQVDDAGAAPSERRYWLPAGHVEVLVERDNPNYLAPLAQLMVGTVYPLPAILDAFRTGGGVPFGEYGADLREGQGGMNRAAFLQLLGREWLPSIPDVHARLQADPAARVAEIGAGVGWASIGLARAYPKVWVDGYDLDAPSVALARDNAREMGVSDRVQFAVRDAAAPASAGSYDLVLAFECIHDMADPVAALRAMRDLAGEGGVVIVMDERVGESFAARNENTEWFMYGFSVLHCLPVGLADRPSAGTGTVMRPETFRRYAIDAGFRGIAILPIDNYFFTFYRLIP